MATNLVRNTYSTIFLGNTAPHTTLREVSEWFQDEPINYIVIEHHWDFCFVGFQEHEDAENAIAELNDTHVDGFLIRAEYARKNLDISVWDQECSVFIGNLPSDCSPADIASFMEPYGWINSIDIKRNSGLSCYAFVGFEDPGIANNVRHMMSNYVYQGRDLSVDFVSGTINSSLIRDQHGLVHVYTDGSCFDNGYKDSRAAIGVWFGDDHPWNTSRRVNGPETNNVAEFEAATEAVDLLKNFGIDKIVINTDSKFVINCITKWWPCWELNGWRKENGEPVVNKQQILDLLDATQDIEVFWNYVPGHKQVKGNEEAHKLAQSSLKA